MSKVSSAHKSQRDPAESPRQVKEKKIDTEAEHAQKQRNLEHQKMATLYSDHATIRQMLQFST